MKKRWWVLGGLGALTLGVLCWANRRRFTVHDITTGESTAYPELRSRVYYADPTAVLSAAEHAVRAMPRWQMIRADPLNFALDAVALSSFSGRTDDVTVYVAPLGGGQSRAIIRARSGRVNGGRSAGHIRDLQEAMDARLTRDAAF